MIHPRCLPCAWRRPPGHTMMVRFLRHGDMAACLLVQGPKARNVFSTREFPIAVRHLTMIFSTSANDSEKTGLKFKLLRFRRDGKKNNFSSEKAQHESQKIASRNTTRHGLRFFDLYIYISKIPGAFWLSSSC